MRRVSREEARYLAEQKRLNSGLGDVLSQKPRLPEDRVSERVAIRLNAAEHRHLRRELRENGTRYRGFTRSAAFNHPTPKFTGPKWPEYAATPPLGTVRIIISDSGEKKK